MSAPNRLPFSPLTDVGLRTLDDDARWACVINLTQPDRMNLLPEVADEARSDALAAARFSMELHEAAMQRIDARRVTA